MLVKATKASSNLRVNIRELGRIAKEGETFNVSDARFKVLNGANRFNAQFVTKVEAPKPVQKSVPAPTSNKAPVKEGNTVTNEEPDIWLIEPGKEPVKVDKNLKPIPEKVKKEEKKEPVKETIVEETKVEEQIKEVVKEEPPKVETKKEEAPKKKKSTSLKVKPLEEKQEKPETEVAKLDTNKDDSNL